MRLRSRALLAAALALGTALAAACGKITTPAPTSSATSAAGSASAALPTGSQYAKYYKPNGAAVTLQSGKTVTIQLSDYKFTPNTLTVASGTAVTLELQNTATDMPHNFTLDAWNVSVNVSPGQSAPASFTPDAPGTYYFYCNVPGHAQLGMVGKLIVTAGGSSASSASSASSSTATASSSAAAAGSSSSAAAVSVAPRSSASAAAPASSASSAPPPASSSAAPPPQPSLPTASQYAPYYTPGGSVAVKAGQAVSMQVTEFKFTPNTLDVAKGTPVTIHIQNVGTLPHTFTLPAWSVNQVVNPGSSATVQFTPTATGTYYWYCAEPGHAQQGMVGKIVVS